MTVWRQMLAKRQKGAKRVWRMFQHVGNGYQIVGSGDVFNAANVNRNPVVLRAPGRASFIQLNAFRFEPNLFQHLREQASCRANIECATPIRNEFLYPAYISRELFSKRPLRCPRRSKFTVPVPAIKGFNVLSGRCGISKAKSAVAASAKFPILRQESAPKYRHGGNSRTKWTLRNVQSVSSS